MSLDMGIPLTADSASGGISINEVCSDNTYYKAPDGEIYSWLEICNGSSSAVDMSGWGLTDDPEDLRKCTLPAGAVIQSGQKIVFFCSPNHAPIDVSKDENILILSDRNGKIIDQLEFSKTATNMSYGQYPDGSGNYFAMDCTPYRSNNSPNQTISVDAPVLSHESGFYDEDFMLDIDVPAGTTVYYTLDGSDPDISSEKYNTRIRVYDKSDSPNVLSARTDISAYGASAPVKTMDKAFVIRAVAVDEEGRKSNTVTGVYFLGKTNASYYKEMKVISIVTDPVNLFDYNTGIYVLGAYYSSSPAVEAWNRQANYTQKGREWERKAVFEVFEKGELVLSDNVGIRIKGATSRATPQKSFNIFAREEYGNKKLDYDFFSGDAVNALTGKPIKKFDTLTIRNAGNDIALSYLRDNINQTLVNDRSNLTRQAMDECILFIDGEFWGFYTLTEKTDDDFIKNHYDIKKSDVAIIKNNKLEEGTEEDLTEWNNTISKYARKDLTVDENYKEFCSEFDVDSMIEYFAVQIYWANSDWPWNNIAVWHSKGIEKNNPYYDGRWRFLLFDTDFTTGLYANTDTSYNTDAFARIKGYSDSLSRTFSNLLKNPDFKEKFCTVFMDLANNNFNPDVTDSVIEEYREKYRQQILDTCERYYASTMTYANGKSKFDEEMDIIKSFYQKRFDYAVGSMQRSLCLNGSLKDVTLKKNNQGNIAINTVIPDISNKTWNGRYFSDYNISLKAIPEKDYKFEKWNILGAELTEKEISSPEITIPLEKDIIVQAVFSKS